MAQDINLFTEQANQFHPSIKFTAAISENQINFLDTIIYKGDRFQTDAILDIKTHYKPTETFQYTHFTSCHPPGVKRGFVKGEATRLLRTNSSQTIFEECLSNFKLRLKARGYPNRELKIEKFSARRRPNWQSKPGTEVAVASLQNSNIKIAVNSGGRRLGRLPKRKIWLHIKN